MVTVKHFDSFNERRYGNPWIAFVDPQNGKPNFGEKAGNYTGRYGNGEAGDLFLYNMPKEKEVFMYGQKDYRGGNTVKAYVQFINGEFRDITSDKLVEALNDYAAALGE